MTDERLAKISDYMTNATAPLRECLPDCAMAEQCEALNECVTEVERLHAEVAELKRDNQWLREFRDHAVENEYLCSKDYEPDVGIFPCAICHPDTDE